MLFIFIVHIMLGNNNKEYTDNRIEATGLAPWSVTTISKDQSANMTVDASFFIHSSSKAVHPNFIEFYKGGEKQGSVSAEFDFSELPSEFHPLVISSIRSICMNMPVYPPMKKEEKPKEEKKTFIRTMMDKIRK